MNYKWFKILALAIAIVSWFVIITAFAYFIFGVLK